MNRHTKALFHSFRDTIAACGTYHFAPAKTRIAILARVRFAGVTAITDESIIISFALPRRLRAARFASVAEVAPGWWAHRIRITDTKQFDQQLQGWIRDSYQLMGMQERLAAKAPRARGGSRMPHN